MIPHTMSYALRGNELGWSAGSGTLQFLYKLTSLPMCGFIAQLVELRTGIAEVTGLESR